MIGREERLARNEVTARAFNEAIEQGHLHAQREGYIRMLCECADAACDRLVAISVAEYEEIRKDPRRFIVAHGHVLAQIEVPVTKTDRYTVVEKREGTPADVAEEGDPRA